MNFVSLRQYQLSVKAYTLYPITKYKFFSNESFYFRFLWDILFLILNMSIKANLQINGPNILFSFFFFLFFKIYTMPYLCYKF